MTIGPWALFIIYDVLLYLVRAVAYEIPYIGGRARGRQRPRAPTLAERPNGRARTFSIGGPMTSGSETDDFQTARAKSRNAFSSDDSNAIAEEDWKARGGSVRSKSRRRCLWYGQRPTTKLRRLYAAIQYNLCHGRSSVHARIVRSVQRSMTMAIIVSRTTIRTQKTPMRTSASIARIITPRAIRTSERFSAKLGNINHSWQV